MPLVSCRRWLHALFFQLRRKPTYHARCDACELFWIHHMLEVIEPALFVAADGVPLVCSSLKHSRAATPSNPPARCQRCPRCTHQKSPIEMTGLL